MALFNVDTRKMPEKRQLPCRRLLDTARPAAHELRRRRQDIHIISKACRQRRTFHNHDAFVSFRASWRRQLSFRLTAGQMKLWREVVYAISAT